MVKEEKQNYGNRKKNKQGIKIGNEKHKNYKVNLQNDTVASAGCNGKPLGQCFLKKCQHFTEENVDESNK